MAVRAQSPHTEGEHTRANAYVVHAEDFKDAMRDARLFDGCFALLEARVTLGQYRRGVGIAFKAHQHPVKTNQHISKAQRYVSD